MMAIRAAPTAAAAILIISAYLPLGAREPIVRETVLSGRAIDVSASPRLSPDRSRRKAGNAANVLLQLAAEAERNNFELKEYLTQRSNAFSPAVARRMADDWFVPSLERAALMRFCEWDVAPSSEVLFGIPRVQNIFYRLALLIRSDIREGKVNDALHKLQLAFAMTDHIRDHPALESVGMAWANHLLDLVEELIQTEKAPNLYWAIQRLPPSADLLSFGDWHQRAAFSHIPDLAERIAQAKDGDWSELRRLMGHNGEPLVLDLNWARSRIPVGSVQGMSTDETFVRVHFNEVQRVARASADAILLPPPQAVQRLGTIDAELDRLPLAVSRAAPSIHDFYLGALRIERRKKLLIILEAIRDHIEGNGELPDSLDSVAQFIPIDPLTNAPFFYEAADTKGVVMAPGIRIGTVEYGKITVKFKIAATNKNDGERAQSPPDSH